MYSLPEFKIENMLEVIEQVLEKKQAKMKMTGKYFARVVGILPCRWTTQSEGCPSPSRRCPVGSGMRELGAMYHSIEATTNQCWCIG